MQAKSRLLVATLGGALTMFVWGGLSHMVLLKGVGFTPLPNDNHVVSELRGVPAGLYVFPAIDFDKKVSAEEQALWEAKFRAGPSGMIVVREGGAPPVSPQKLFFQALSHLLASLIATFIVSLLAGASRRRRVAVVGSLGAFAWLTITTIYWNWYGFPTAFALAQLVDMVVGWSLAGAVIVAVLGPDSMGNPPTESARVVGKI